jgi:hypothetical protein
LKKGTLGIFLTAESDSDMEDPVTGDDPIRGAIAEAEAEAESYAAAFLVTPSITVGGNDMHQQQQNPMFMAKRLNDTCSQFYTQACNITCKYDFCSSNFCACTQTSGTFK